MEQFDLISDLHLDFWFNRYDDYEIEVEPFVKSILPKEISKVLVIAGDLGHYNIQNLKVLTALKEYYEYILIVPGNHDFYLQFSGSYYNFDSMVRWNEMIEMCSNLENVHVLNGTIVEIDGIKFGGTGMWYDFSYGINVLGTTMDKIINSWESNMSDSWNIKGLPHEVFKMYWEEDKKLQSIIEDCDVIVTHVSPDWSQVIEMYRNDIHTSFFYFDGRKYFDQIKGKIWCYGHTHTKNDHFNSGCWFVNNALGYPNKTNPQTTPIVNIPLGVNERI